LIFEPSALAFGPITNAVQIEFHRKVRNIANGLNGVKEMKQLLNPFEYGFYSLQLFSHKVLRRLMIFPLIGLLISSFLLWTYSPFYKWMAILQTAFYAAGWLYFFIPSEWGKVRKVFSLAFFFQVVNAAAVV